MTYRTKYTPATFSEETNLKDNIKRMKVNGLVAKLKQSKLFKDSFWAIFGNGLGTALLLIAGIIIARYLGKDVYGEYGVVKTNMFYIAGFSTFGLGLTSTRFIAKYLGEDRTQIIGIIKTATAITIVFSTFLAIIIAVFSQPLAEYLNSPTMARPFKFLSFIIIVKSLGTTSNGILSGLGDFKSIAQNAIFSGLVMLISCVPLTYFYGLDGSLAALSLSQIINTGLNYYKIRIKFKQFPIYYKAFNPKELISFSFPIAMQEISYSVCNWIGILALTKYSSMGEVGIYSATAQWNAVILFIPGLLHNVVLSHLSKSQTTQSHKKNIRALLTVYLICTVIPFLCVYCFSSFIASFYGKGFGQMIPVLRILTLATIPLCCSDVFKSEFLAIGHPWILFSIRCIKDVIFVGAVIFFLTHYTTIGGALSYAICNLIISILFFVALYLAYIFTIKKNS